MKRQPYLQRLPFITYNAPRKAAPSHVPLIELAKIEILHSRALLQLTLNVPGRRTSSSGSPTGPYRERHPSQNLLPHISPRYMSPHSYFPNRPPWKEVPLSRAFF
jgi:hypothetical protein